MRKLKIFVASPSDVSQERDIVSLVVEELRRSLGELLKIELETIRWETHSWPDIGDDAQDVINKQIDEYDVLVGMMWKRFGTATKRASSGTGEEFERAYEFFKKYNRPKIMIYFRTTPFYSTSQSDISQFRKVVQFRKKIEKLGVYYREYNDILEFERQFREQLSKQIVELSNSYKSTAEKERRLTRIFLSYAREDLKKVEQIYDALKAAGFDPWLDVRDILPGSQWITAIQKAILKSDFFVTCISRNSVNKRGFIQREIQTALEIYEEQLASDVYLLPVRLEETRVPKILSKYQWIDVFLPNGIDKLITTINVAVKRQNMGNKGGYRLTAVSRGKPQEDQKEP
jgi:hypothetical protein